MSKHVQKALQKMAKKNTAVNASVTNLKGQYEVIRNDLIKLRDDLQKGFDMAKSEVEKNSFIGQFIKTK